MGYEYVTNYGLFEEAEIAAEQAQEKRSAKSIAPGKHDFISDPSHLFLTRFGIFCS